VRGFIFLLVGTVGHVHFLVCGNSIIFFHFHPQLIISIHCYILFDMSYVFTCRTQRPLSSDRSRFLGCCTVSRRRLTWSRRLRWRWRLMWSSRLSRRTTVRRTTVRRRRVRRRRVQDRGRLAACQL
jgi:hypothetical protein